MNKGFFIFSLTLGAALAGAQSFNIDFSQRFGGVTIGTVPAPTYGAAGQAGFWNGPDQTASSFALFDLGGNASTALYTVNSWNSVTSYTSPPAGWVVGNDFSLFQDFFELSTTISISGLQAGVYEIIMYGSNPGNIAGGSYTINSVTQSTTGNAWTGSSVLGATHTVFSNVNVTGTLSVAMQGVANGMQIRQLNPVPEPFTMTLLGAGALVAYRRKRRALNS